MIACVGPPVTCVCGHTSFDRAFVYEAPPAGEIRFGFASGDAYHREIWRCAGCGHYISRHDMDATALYAGDYVTSNYGQRSGIEATFRRIVSLPPGQSDNTGRVACVVAMAKEIGVGRDQGQRPRILDVGSGLCVFLHGIRTATDWECVALDPDGRSAEHAREVVGVDAHAGDFASAGDLGTFDVITFNKVLEHVVDPIDLLARAKPRLRSGGFVYVELPDGEAASVVGPSREEFFIDHWHVFSVASARVLCERAGFEPRAIERLREPSGKFTLRAFMMLPGNTARMQV